MTVERGVYDQRHLHARFGLEQRRNRNGKCIIHSQNFQTKVRVLNVWQCGTTRRRVVGARDVWSYVIVIRHVYGRRKRHSFVWIVIRKSATASSGVVAADM